jgi:hypothetical protein
MRHETGENMAQNDSRSPGWRRTLLEKHLLTALIALELVLSAIFLLIGYLAGNGYLRGVGVGLVIAWVTSGIALVAQRTIVHA